MLLRARCNPHHAVKHTEGSAMNESTDEDERNSRVACKDILQLIQLVPAYAPSQ